MSVNLSMNMTMTGYSSDPGLVEQWQSYDAAGYTHGGYDEDCIKEEEMHPRSFALFDAPSKMRFSAKASPRFMPDDKQVTYIHCDSI